MKLFQGVAVMDNPLLPLAALGASVGIQFVGLGLLGEVLARVYYGHPGKSNYAVRETINFDDTAVVHRVRVV